MLRYTPLLSDADARDGAAFAFTTADRREWHVSVSDAALRWLTQEAEPTACDVARALTSGAHHLELAALRRIARGTVDGDRIALDAADLGAR